MLVRARDAMGARGQRLNEALTSIDVGTALAAAGRVLEADAELDRAAQTLEALGSWASAMAACRRALLLWTAGRDAEGNAVAAGLDPESTFGRLAGVVRLADSPDDVAFDGAVARVTAEVKALEADLLAEAVAVAADRARRAGRTSRAATLGALDRRDLG